MARSAAQELQRPRRVCLPEKIRVPGRKRKPRRGARPVGGGLLAVHGHHEARAGVRVVVALPSEQALPNGTRVVWQRERRAEATRLAFARLAVVRLTRGAPAVAPARRCALHSRRMPKSALPMPPCVRCCARRAHESCRAEDSAWPTFQALHIETGSAQTPSIVGPSSPSTDLEMLISRRQGRWAFC